MDPATQVSTPENTGRNTKGRARGWCFTWNGYDEGSLRSLTQCFRDCAKYVVQEEVCPKTGADHLQGVLYFTQAKTFSAVQKYLPGAHLEKVKRPFAAFNYCQKQKSRKPGGKQWIGGLEITCPDPLEGKELYPWQAMVMDLLAQEPDERTILWLWESKGCVGKTALCKSICLNNDRAYYVSGKASDMKCAIAGMAVKPTILLMGLTRSIEEYVSYQGIEEVKDGIFFSGKYESKMVMYKCPHVVVFANFPPQTEKMSADRWRVVEIV